MKGLKILLTPEVLVEGELVKKAFKFAWGAIERAGYSDCLDKDGNLPVEIYVGREERPHAEIEREIKNRCGIVKV